MLRVNLLPPDRRQRERTPLPRFIILLIGVALITTELAVCGYGYMEWLELLREQERLQAQKEEQQPKVEEFQELKRDIQQLQQRQEVLNEIRPDGLKEKYQWSYAIDQLFEVIDQTPGVWIENLDGRMESGGGRGASAALSLSFNTKSASPLSRLTGFQELMKRRLIQEEQVFSKLNRTWYPYDENTDEGRKYWSTQYTLQRVDEDGNN